MEEKHVTKEEVWAGFARLEQMMAATDRQIEATDRQMQESARTTESLKATVAETARQIEATNRQMKETARIVAHVSDQLGKIGNHNGEFAEEYFYSSLNEKKVFAGIRFDDVTPNVKSREGKLEDEFDIVLYNHTAIAIVEVKYHVSPGYLEKMVEKKVPHFRALFPTYANHEIYLGIGSMSFNKDILKRAHELGIGVLKQKCETIEADTAHIRAY
jgi:hypothetical protein